MAPIEKDITRTIYEEGSYAPWGGRETPSERKGEKGSISKGKGPSLLGETE